MKKRRIKKSTLILLGFTLYSVVVYSYFIPRVDMAERRIWMTIALNIAILAALWLLYRHKEKMADKREKEMNINQQKR